MGMDCIVLSSHWCRRGERVEDLGTRCFRRKLLISCIPFFSYFNNTRNKVYSYEAYNNIIVSDCRHCGNQYLLVPYPTRVQIGVPWVRMEDETKCFDSGLVKTSNHEWMNHEESQNESSRIKEGTSTYQQPLLSAIVFCWKTQIRDLKWYTIMFSVSSESVSQPSIDSPILL